MDNPIRFSRRASPRRACRAGMARPMIRSVLAVFLLTLLSACVHTEVGEGQAEEKTVANELWRLDYLVADETDASPPETDATAYLHLGEDGRVEGYGGCNQIVGTYRQTGDRIEFSQLASTRRACFTGMEREEAFLKALENVRLWMLEGDSLYLYGGEEEQLLLLMKAMKNPD